MQCPYCGRQMQTGVLRCIKNTPVWYADDVQVSWTNRNLGGAGRLTGGKTNFSTLDIPGTFCPACKKLTLDTGVVK